ncbi:hypothetical protein BDY19DRAFT_978648 [Irpex rosettiformis]|uniref:Uncharacterized protein n=1 Tax=Irpex rosettiformis TaxID=378272 RepID=A0ACB8TN65_9APHY|nr:hypothetical protein BDY19DRAFT_978648 [Irpex rosettiformis]
MPRIMAAPEHSIHLDWVTGAHARRCAMSALGCCWREVRRRVQSHAVYMAPGFDIST